MQEHATHNTRYSSNRLQQQSMAYMAILEDKIAGDSEESHGIKGESINPSLGFVVFGNVDGKVSGVRISSREAMPGPEGAIWAAN